MATKTYDAVIVGSGPAGAAAGRRLVQAGMKTLIIEKNKLPRRKMCSGCLSHWSVDFVHRHFGPLPLEVYTETPFLEGFGFNFPSITETVKIPSKGPIPYIRRKEFDYFLAKKSGAQIMDGLFMEGIELAKNGFKITCRRNPKKGKTNLTQVQAKYVVAADGFNSRSVRCILPGAQRGMPLTTAIQKFYYGEIDLNPNLFHLFFYPGTGFFPWANRKGNRIVAGVSGLYHRKAIQYHDAFVAMLQQHYGLKIKETILAEGMGGYTMAPVNKFILGRGNFLAAGDAAGFIHGAEGISAALVSGDVAAQSILKAEEKDGEAINFYRNLAQDEVNRCLDQTNLLRMVKNSSLRMDPKPIWTDRPLERIPLMARDIKAFLAQDTGLKETDLGKISKKNMIHHLLHGRYPVDL